MCIAGISLAMFVCTPGLATDVDEPGGYSIQPVVHSAVEGLVGIGSGGTPVHVSHISNGSAGAKLANPWGVYVSGNYAYVASYSSNALEIVDVSDPSNPVHAGCISDGDGGAKLNGTRAVFVSGYYAYVPSALSKALEIVDVSDPTNPVHVTSISDGDGGAKLSSPRGVVISGDYAYVTSGMFDDALNIVDVSDPTHPVLTANISPVGDGPYSLAVSGNYAYIASCDSDEVHTVDVSDPTNPVRAGSISNGDGGAKLALPFDINVSGNYAYVASFFSNALEILNVSDPAHPVHAGFISDGGDVELYGARGVFVSGNYAYVASQSSDPLYTDGNALEIVDVSDPASPVHAGSIRNGDNGAKLAGARNVYVSNNYAYVTSHNSSPLATPDSDALEIVFFYEGDPFPNITRVTPDSGVNSGTCVATITGSNFQSGVNVDLTRAGEPNITATDVSTLSFTTITCTFALTGRAAGPWNVVVTNPDGQPGILANGFNITNSAPTVTSISPETAKQGTTVQIKALKGTGFVPGAKVKLVRPGEFIPMTDVTVENIKTITGTFVVPANAEAGRWTVLVKNPDGQKGKLGKGFSVEA